MNGLGEAAGSGVPIVYKGKTHLLPAPTIRDWGAIENHLIAERRKTIIDLVVNNWDKFPNEEEARRQLDRAYDSAREVLVSIDDTQEFAQTPHGAAYLTWVLLCRALPGETIPFEDVWDAMKETDETEMEDIKNRLSQASGLDQLGNSEAPDQAGAENESALTGSS